MMVELELLQICKITQGTFCIARWTNISICHEQNCDFENNLVKNLDVSKNVNFWPKILEVAINVDISKAYIFHRKFWPKRDIFYLKMTQLLNWKSSEITISGPITDADRNNTITMELHWDSFSESGTPFWDSPLLIGCCIASISKTITS